MTLISNVFSFYFLFTFIFYLLLFFHFSVKKRQNVEDQNVTFVESLILIEADNIDTYFADKITQNKTIAILQEEMYMKRAEAILEVLNPVL